MRLARLAARLEEEGFEVRLEGPGDPVLERVCLDSRRVRPGDLFCALPGCRRDGREFLAEAVDRGARAVLLPGVRGGAAPPPPSGPGVPVLLARKPRRTAARAAALLAGEPAASLWLAAVTGTNGKTTVAWLVAGALERAGVPCAVLGTLGTRFRDLSLSLDNTTPPADLLHEHLAAVLRAGARAAVLEASSHGLDQERLAGLAPDAGAWTNLTRDHLDYHRDLEEYARAKARLADLLPADAPLFLPAADARILRACAGARGRVVPWALDPSGPGLRGRSETLPGGGIRLTVTGPWGPAEVESPLVGRHNAENLLLAFGLLRSAGLAPEEAARALGAAPGAPGRLERVATAAPWLLYVDYAHTPDALARVLAALREAHPGRRLGVVFGAGGDRDQGKREPMGRAAAAGADWCLVTSDNPRHEDPAAIAAAVARGVEAAGRRAEIVLDRRRALTEAVARLRPGDVLLVAGKGHETWQEVAGVRHPFDDRQVLQEVVAACVG